MHKLFLNENDVNTHKKEQEANYPLYSCTLLNFLFQGVNIIKSAKPRILAACWASKRYDLPELLLTRFDTQFGFVEILRALKILDTNRQIRVLEKRLLQLNKQEKVKTKKVGDIKSKINDLQKERLPEASVSGSLAKKVNKFLYSIDEEKLAFFALNMPKEPWQELANITHPSSHKFVLPWFLEYMYGKPAPEGSVIKLCDGINSENVVSVLKQVNVPYSYLRLHAKPLSELAKSMIAEYTPLDTLIWYHEELNSPEVNATINKRLSAGEKPKFGYGKLVERLMYFQSIKASFCDMLIPIAEQRLQAIKIALDAPVAVFGDASNSMDVAIKTSTIIASVLTALTDARLTFFSNGVVEAPCNPKNIKDVLHVANTVKASGLTRPAACLWTYYKLRQVAKCIVIVSDEDENLPYYGHYFVDLLEMYRKDVYPAKIVFVSFLANPSAEGPMVKELEEKGIECLQFRLGMPRPDLTKLDDLLGQLSCDSGTVVSIVEGLVKTYKESGIKSVVECLETISLTPSVDEDNIKQAQGELAQKAKAALTQLEMERVMLAKLESILGNKPVPDDFICPITRLLFREPTITADGHTYEKSAITLWLQNHDTSPLTGAVLESKKLLPNHTLRKAIKELCDRVGVEPEKLEEFELESQSVAKKSKGVSLVMSDPTEAKIAQITADNPNMGEQELLAIFYTEFAGQNDIQGADKDGHANPLGRKYDLGREGAFKMFSIILYSYYNTNSIWKECEKALQEKGFQVVVCLDEKTFLDTMHDHDQAWVVSGSGTGDHHKLCVEIQKMHDCGKSVFIWADNDPFFTHANSLLNHLKLGYQLEGNVPGGKPLKLAKSTDAPPVGHFKPDLLTTGIVSLFEGITICYPNKITDNMNVIGTGTDGKSCFWSHQLPSGRIIVDCGFTKLYCNWDSAGTARFVRNCAVWLAGIDWRVRIGANIKGAIDWSKVRPRHRPPSYKPAKSI